MSEEEAALGWKVWRALEQSEYDGGDSWEFTVAKQIERHRALCAENTDGSLSVELRRDAGILGSTLLEAALDGRHGGISKALEEISTHEGTFYNRAKRSVVLAWCALSKTGFPTIAEVQAQMRKDNPGVPVPEARIIRACL